MYLILGWLEGRVIRKRCRSWSNGLDFATGGMFYLFLLGRIKTLESQLKRSR
jgi:hypothetical protein